MTVLDDKTLDLSIDDVLDVWHDLELALAGKNGYGGDVAEIYAHRLVPTELRAQLHQKEAAPTAQIAGRNLTHILRRFVSQHDGTVISTQTARDAFAPLDLSTDFPPFDWRVHIRVEQVRPPMPAPSTQRIREAIAEVAKHGDTLVAMLDELTMFRAKARLKAEPTPAADTSDLPPDAATGLYLDRPFDVEDFTWLKMAWQPYLQRLDASGPARPGQIHLVFSAIARDARATTEFLRVMNTIMLPLLRRLRLKEQPHLTRLGAASE